MTEASHFRAGSALLEFIAGRLGAPACWPNQSYPKLVYSRMADEASAIQRWETEGGTIAATAPTNSDFGRVRKLPPNPTITHLLI